ncbi:MAG: GAF domain-containing protein [Acidobacteriia bacterium]|nr:GAF domain-containing protein [Terriglobia bacterium]
MSLGASANVIAAPVAQSQLLEMIVRTASRVIDARAASLCLLDESAKELVFEVVQGEKSEELRKIRVPMGHGIVGLVAATGQAMAISNVGSDPRHAADVARRVGYMPQSILAVPLLYADRVIGVLELLDKNGKESFGAADLETLGLFANQAAIAIQQSRAQTSITSMLMQLISAFGPVSPGRQRGIEKAAAAVARDVNDPAHRHAMELSGLIHEIVQYGNGETAACRALLESFASYLRSRLAGGPRRASADGALRRS